MRVSDFIVFVDDVHVKHKPSFDIIVLHINFDLYLTHAYMIDSILPNSNFRADIQR